MLSKASRPYHYPNVSLCLFVIVLGLFHDVRSWTLWFPLTRTTTRSWRVFTVPSSLCLSSPVYDENMSPDYFLLEDMYDDDDEELEAALGDWDQRVAQLNTLHLVGRVATPSEPRFFDDGKVVVSVGLACPRKLHWLERQEQNIKYGEEETDWFTLNIWGKQAEFVSKYVEKGARVAVTGELVIEEWVDKSTGERRNGVKVNVREFDILETKAEAELRRSNQRGPSVYPGSRSSDEDDVYDPSTGSSDGFFS